MVRLKVGVQKELKKTYAAFTDGVSIDKHKTEVRQSLTHDMNEIIKGVAKKLKIEPRGIRVEVEFNDVEDNTSIDITVKYKGQEKEFSPSNLYYQRDKGADLDEAMGSNPEYAWLGHDDSPFHTQQWVDDYHESQMLDWAMEAASTIEDDRPIAKGIEHLLLEHENGDQEEAARHYKRAHNW